MNKASTSLDCLSRMKRNYLYLELISHQSNLIHTWSNLTFKHIIVINGELLPGIVCFMWHCISKNKAPS